jgi:predicted O-methyltransferase YrrM
LWTLSVTGRHRRRREEIRGRRKLSGVTTLSFTADYVSDFTEMWAKHLAPLAGKESLRFLEIGSFEGRSAIWFAENVLTHRDSRLVCVDTFGSPGLEARFDHNTRVAGVSEKIEKRKGRSEDILPTLAPASFDFIYVDGGHDAATVMFDAVASMRLLRRGGILAFDDYDWAPEKPLAERPKIAIDLFEETFGERLERIERSYQVWYRKR